MDNSDERSDVALLEVTEATGATVGGWSSPR